ncbi:MAG: hypothetical protein HKN29_04670 [Rhodothermales bacterium]|nr:hypothetical protein [Rhodothermales bacterium]
MGIKDILLNKGWAGRTIDRPETIERINPVIMELTGLMHFYEDAAARLGGTAADEIHGSLRIMRGDIGKLCEVVYSCGGVAYSGTDIEPGSLKLGDSLFEELADRERAFVALVAEEADVEHQIRTRAVLSVAGANGETRLKVLRGLSGR